MVGFYQTIRSQLNIAGLLFAGKIIGGEATTSPDHPSSIWVTKEELVALAEAGKLFTSYPPQAVEDYTTRGVFPLEVVTTNKL